MRYRPVVALPLLALLGACGVASPPASSTQAVPGCNARKAQPWVGRPATDAALEAARKASGARTLRVFTVEEAPLMDDREDRLNAMVDERRIITALSCDSDYVD